ncbi:hypothetical protein RND71_031347 [Anisodus tanguticus]|uniref:50S ribosomal protein 6, chloroplastic n=1 Tax=Anisodus tanguticus TaxID=243964 RepID=A0AAE1UYT2_9SOLA|nr:hypothetical protein RND71_031347 [Anisodus tanguticus]
MSASAILGLPRPSTTGFPSGATRLPRLVIECSSRPQKKATAHHKKTRPRKTQAWDIKRGPTVYAPLPPLPPEWSFASDESGQPDSVGASDSNSNTKSQ